MSAAPAVARHEQAGRLEATRVGLRFATADALERSGDGPSGLDWTEGLLRPGSQRLGPFEVRVTLDSEGASARVGVSVRNLADAPLHVEAIVMGFRWCEGRGDAPRFLRHGWQSWSFTGGRALDEDGEPAFPSGSWLRGFHHGRAETPADRAYWHESDLVSVAASAGRGACLAGLLEQGGAMGAVYLQPSGRDVRVEVEALLEVPVAPGEWLAAEPALVALGSDESRLLEDYADALGRDAGARTASPFQTGWCSWYQFFHDVDETAFLRNLDSLSSHRAEIPIDVVQLDDGYQRAIGDWLECNEKFPRGIAPLAAAVRDAGFRPGIWTAPFCVTEESRVFAGRPEWLLRDDRGGFFRGLIHPMWSERGSVYVLDTSRPDVRDHLMRVFAGLVGMGFSYLKLDFLYSVAMRARAHDRTVTRAGRLREGLLAVRRGAGEEAFLLGCGCPMGAAVGLVDGMRIGPDVAPHWDTAREMRIPGLEPTMPSAANSIRNVLSRAWMHRRLWLNDPDCLMVRTRDTDLQPVEATTLAASIAATGGMIVFSDDIPSLSESELARLRETIALGREVDAAGARGTARAIDLLGGEFATGVVGRAGDAALVTLLNSGDAACEVDVDLSLLVAGASGLPAQPLLGTPDREGIVPGGFSGTLAPHESAVLRVLRHPRLAVFCDYDGTFAIQDVGATLARTYAADRRTALWDRLRAGELGPWEYNMELLDGLALPEERLDAFLRTVEPDPGAHALVAWCEAHEVPFRVLSDGFDRNLDRLQELHGVRFAYEANRLWYEGGRWRIAPGHPDPSCSCGTGTCKHSRIRAFRAQHPGVTVVHVGNGRVSDLCAARGAQVVFAKDTLAEELERQGVAYEPFETLHDVVAGLERLEDKLRDA